MVRGVTGDQPASTAISHLAIGSAVASIQTDQRRVDALREGLATIATAAEIPSGWSVDSVAALLDLHRTGKRGGVEAVGLRIAGALSDIDDIVAANAKRSIGSTRTSLGSVRGELYRYNGRQRTAALSQAGTLKIVAVYFSIGLASKVRSALDGEVEIWGEVTRNVYDEIESIVLEGLEVTATPKAQVALDDVVGLFGAEWTDGLDSVEWVRRQRDC